MATVAMLATGCTSKAAHDSKPGPTPSSSDYAAPPPSLPVDQVQLSTSPPPWPAPAATGAGDVQGRYPTAAGLPFRQEMLTIHYHAHLDVIVDGKAVPVPGGIGFVGAPPNHYTALAPLHTHDASGIIHIENSVPAKFVLGQFFIEWGLRLTSSCIGGLCSGNGKQLAVYVDGKPYSGDPNQIVLTKHEEIAILYGATGKLPTPPSSYNFPTGD